MGAGNLRPVVGRLAAGGGVEDAADALDRLGDLHRIGPVLGALEEHVLEEVGDAGDSGRLVAGPTS